MTFMPNFIEMRNRLGFTQEDLAKAAGLRKESISRIEKGRQPHQKTIQKLAIALKVSEDMILEAIALAKKNTTSKGLAASWTFLKEMDPDIQKGCIESLVLEWTHGSTGLEGNTLSIGDTHLILSEGITISGKSLLEHQEVHGHRNAIELIQLWFKSPVNISIRHLHELHRAVQTGMVIDIFKPVGAFKNEPNGTNAILSSGLSEWHEYALPMHVPNLIDSWLNDLKHTFSDVKKKNRQANHSLMPMQELTLVSLQFIHMPMVMVVWLVLWQIYPSLLLVCHH